MAVTDYADVEPRRPDYGGKRNDTEAVKFALAQILTALRRVPPERTGEILLRAARANAERLRRGD